MYHPLKFSSIRQIPICLSILLCSLVLAFASSHREAPLIRHLGPLDNTDVYAFVSPDNPGTVTLISNWYGVQEPNGGPNFYGWPEFVKFKIYVDNDGDAKEEVIIQCVFETEIRNSNTFLYNTGPISSLDDPNWNIRQFYTFRFQNKKTGIKIREKDLAVPPDNIGPASIPFYESLAAAAVHDLGNGFKVFAGQRDDPFYVDLGAVFDLLTIRPGAPGNMGGGVDGLGGFNVNSIAVQVPISALTKDGSIPTDPNDPAAVLGIWSTTEVSNFANLFDKSSLQQTESSDWDDDLESERSSGFRASRLGMPLVNELVIPVGDKDKFNSSRPKQDGQFLKYVLNPEPAALLNLIYGLNVPPNPRNDFVAVFLTGVPGLNQPPDVTPSEMLRLNVAIPPSANPDPLGVLAGDLAGFPNGRRLIDDVVDAALRVTAGVLVPGFDVFPNNALGDGVDQNDLPFLSSFPYLATPHQGFDHQHHRVEPPHTSTLKENGTAQIEMTVNENAAIPDEFMLQQNYPNPFNPETTIDYQLPEAAYVKLRIYNVKGELVRTLISENQAAGHYAINWDATSDQGNKVASGLYFYRIETPQYVKSRHMILLK